MKVRGTSAAEYNYTGKNTIPREKEERSTVQRGNVRENSREENKRKKKIDPHGL